MRICIYAFSTTALFFRGLIDACAAAGDDVEWSVICPQGHFRYVFDGAVPSERVCYLYDDFNRVYAGCDESQVQAAMECGDGLVPSLMKDKDGYRWLDKAEQLKRGTAIHHCYRAFLEKLKPDFVIFPNLEVVDGFILMNLCHTMRVGILYAASMRFLGRTCFGPDEYETLPRYLGDYTEADLEEARTILRGFHERRIGYRAGFGYPASPPRKPSLFRRLVVSEYLRWGPERLHATEETQWMRVQRNIYDQLAPIRAQWFELTARQYFDARTDNLPEKFIFYALHQTPESSINGREPFYVDQLRAIDMLLLNLPPGYRLVVKEHPTMYGIRPLEFYRECRRRPGLLLLHPTRDSRELLMRAALVATVTGTIGLEAYLLGKPCLAFGPSFYSYLCRPVPPLSDLRTVLVDIIENHRPPSEQEKEVEVAKMLNVGGNFIIDDPWHATHTMAPGNIAAARDYLWRHFERLKKMETPGGVVSKAGGGNQRRMETATGDIS